MNVRESGKGRRLLTLGLVLSELVAAFQSLFFSQNHPIQLHVDNTSSIQITANPVFHECTKHVFTFLNSYFD